MKIASSKPKIKAAFAALLTTEPFEKITVAQIVSQAEINRGTFYLHYPDKYALAEELSHETLQQLSEITTNYTGGDNQLLSTEGIHQLLHYLRENRNTLQALLFGGTDRSFGDAFKALLLQNIQINESPLPEIYLREMLVAHFMSIIILWLKRNTKESIAEIADLLETGRMSDEWHHLYH